MFLKEIIKQMQKYTENEGFAKAAVKLCTGIELVISQIRSYTIAQPDEVTARSAIVNIFLYGGSSLAYYDIFYKTPGGNNLVGFGTFLRYLLPKSHLGMFFYGFLYKSCVLYVFF